MLDEVRLKTAADRSRCPKCTWEFASRKNRRCPTCGTLLLIPSDAIRDAELAILRSFWMWHPAKQAWTFIYNWEEHKREGRKKLDEYLAPIKPSKGDAIDSRQKCRQSGKGEM